jgi:hypothetical protein
MSEASREYERHKQRLEDEIFSLSRRNVQLEGEASHLVARNKVLERDRKHLYLAQIKLEKICLSKEQDFDVRNMFGKQISKLRKQVMETNMILQKVCFSCYILFTSILNCYYNRFRRRN